jgi:cytosine/adenosine deaminase-related metal-dependent hydrolase
MTMTMGGEIYLLGNPTDTAPRTYHRAWELGRQLNLPIAAHIVGSFGMGPEFDKIAVATRDNTPNATKFGSDNLFIHMTGMSDPSWDQVKRVGAGVSLAVPIEMNMRHGTPPILKTLSMAIPPSLSVDVEVTLTADMFTQMRSAMNLQRMVVNQMILDSPNGNGNLPDPRNWELPQSAITVPGPFPYWPTPPTNLPPPLTTRDVLRYATMNGAKALRLDGKVGSLTPGKEADIILLDATRINVVPLNQVPGAVVSLMDRTNVETVIVAGKIRKWKGQLLNVDLPALRQQIEASRDYIFQAAGVPQNLFSSQ